VSTNVLNLDPGLDPDSTGSVDPDPGRPKFFYRNRKKYIKNFMFEDLSVGLEASPVACMKYEVFQHCFNCKI
jgi:hypothetical protein